MTDVPSEPPKVNLYEFVFKLEKLTHPGIAMTLSARLDNMLSRILQGHMPHLTGRLKERLFEGYGPLYSFSSKIDVAFALGHIKGEEFKILKAIKEIRNKFAHSNAENLDFDNEIILPLMAALPALKKPKSSNLDRFSNAYLSCKALLDKHLESIALVAAVKDRILK